VTEVTGSTIEGIESAEPQEPRRSITPGPLFKEIYAGLIDVEDPSAWRPVLENETRSFLSHTTDIQTLDQFQRIHRTPEKLGTAFHHRAYVATLQSLQS
jgi:hypothetical protein